jgi:ppGpp synthetase/RelA/SpoT-type nucleotidyltranferase
MDPAAELLSKAQVKRAGEQLRYALRVNDMASVVGDPHLAPAWDIVRRFRREHVYPLILVSKEIALLARQADAGPVVPRLKRAERIIEKIARSNTALDRLQDIGGCRVVVSDLDAQRTLCESVLAADLDVVKVNDYVASAGESPFDQDCDGPKGSGYRAIHIVHKVRNRLIETQVRTEVQHQWGVASERAEQITGYALKFGDAPADLLDYFRVASEIHSLQERELPVDTDHIRQLAELREQIRRYYRGSR